MTFVASLAVVTLLNADAPMTAEATAKYTQATQDMQAKAYGPAIEKLNALALQYPKVAEIFASRCSALIANAQYTAAEADCTYATGLKPNLPEAIYALAVAEDRQGKATVAAEHYRKYAAFDGAPLRNQALARATALSSGAPPPPMVAGGAAMGRMIVYRNHRFAGAGGMMLIIDGHTLGDIAYGQYVELELASGAHILEARTRVVDVFDAQQVFTHPVNIGTGTLYVNFDTQGGQIVVQEVPSMQARTEIRDDCQKGWSLRGPFDNLPMAGPPQVAQAPALVVVPGSPAPYAAQPYGSRGGGGYCNSSIDCGSGGFCKDRGDGVRVCMNHGPRGASCQSSIDCGGGLFCKDRGDGMNVCM